MRSKGDKTLDNSGSGSKDDQSSMIDRSYNKKTKSTVSSNNNSMNESFPNIKSHNLDKDSSLIRDGDKSKI